MKERVRLSFVEWADYLCFLRLFAKRPSYQLTYDRGELEILGRRFSDERDRVVLGRLVHVLTEERNSEIVSGGSTTLRRKRLRRGIDPDRCFWIANASRMAGRHVLDLRTDPPPDLVVEVNAARSTLDRLGILGRLGAPEVWHLSGDVLTFHCLSEGGYVETTISFAFPGISASDLIPFVRQSRQGADDNAMSGALRAWLRQQKARPTGTQSA